MLYLKIFYANALHKRHILRECLTTAVATCSHIQSTLVISKSKGPSKTLRDIRTSTYQICSIEEKTILATKFRK